MFLQKRKPEQYIPWNKGKLVGQKPPLKLREISASRIRLQRVVAIDIETCLACGGKPRVIACIKVPASIARTLGNV